MRFLGIDPSIAAVGLGVLELDGLKRTLVHAETVRTDSKAPLEDRLVEIGERVGVVVRTHHPQFAGIEELRFVNAGEHQLGRTNVDNSKSFLAGGAAFNACQVYGCRARFVNPQRVKVAVLGPGRGRMPRPRNEREVHAQRQELKRLVRARLAALLGVDLTCSLDASDALAMAWLLTLEHKRTRWER